MTELRKYLGIELDHCPYGSIHIRKPYLTQRITNMILGTNNSSAKQTLEVNLPLVKNEGAQSIKNTLITDQ